jgi:hypothetical protein
MLGIMQLSYYAGRAVTPALTFLTFPLVIITVAFVDDLSCRDWGATPAVRPTFRWIAGLLAAAAIVSGGMLGDRFFREPATLRSNGVLLRYFLSKHPADGLHQLALIPDKLSQPVGFIKRGSFALTEARPEQWQLIPNAPTTTEDLSAYRLASRWLKGQGSAVIMSPDAATVLFALRVRNAIGLTHAMVDDRSALLRERALTLASRLSSGTVLLVGTIAPRSIEEEVLQELRRTWVMRTVDHDGKVLAIQLQKRRQD